ncbi:MAG: transposase [Isosphaeraceae bacterium]|nr:transposase [Isosphaeraceae bacterium]
MRLMRLIDEQYPAHPFYGSRRMTRWLLERGEEVNRKRVQRLRGGPRAWRRSIRSPG